MQLNQLTMIMEKFREVKQLHCQIINQKKYDLTPEQIRLLFLLSKKEMRQKDLAKLLHIREATLSVRIKRLVEYGYISQKQNMDDKRVSILFLSDDGTMIVKQFYDECLRYRELLCEDITEEEFNVIMNVMHKVENRLREELK